jgi:peptidoglycan hydrolase CwlO-like protein
MDTGFLQWFVSGLVSAVLMAIFGFFAIRHQALRASQEASKSWESLARQREESRNEAVRELNLVKDRISRLEAQLEQVDKENEQLRALNLQYQTEIVSLKKRIAELEAKQAKAGQ